VRLLCTARISANQVAAPLADDDANDDEDDCPAAVHVDIDEAAVTRACVAHFHVAVEEAALPFIGPPSP
jgi:hypothetical protein